MEINKEAKVHTDDVIVAENYLFTKFLLSDELLKSLAEMNYIKPSPIQLKIIPLAKSRLDMIIQSKSGTGKTLAFAICLLETFDENLKFPQALIIVPTREIAVQITNTLNGLGRHLRYFKASEFIGGTDLKNDRKRIQTTKIVVGTPGRILHLIKNEIFNTSNVKAVVFDESDKLFEQGHLGNEVQSIFRAVEHKNLQIIAATATVTPQFESQIKKHMKNPIGITPKHEAPVLLGIKQFAIEITKIDDNIQLMQQKLTELEKIFKKITFRQCLLFTDSQSKTESYGNYLNKLGWKNEVINGSQEQSQRLKILNKLTKFKCRILITTDLMARGIDLENVNLVINLDLPYDCFTYLHRIGRAGRFGTHGIAISLLNGEKDASKFRKMLSEIGSSESMVWTFPDDSVAYNFWDFQNLAQNDGLKKFDGILSNGSDKDVVDENLMLLEITRKLIDQKSDENGGDFDANLLLDDYESVCVNGSDKCEGSSLKIKENGGNLDSLLNEYEKLTSKSDQKSVKALDFQSPKEKRCVVFVKDPKQDEIELTDCESESENEDSDLENEDSEQECDEEQSDSEDDQQQSDIEPENKPNYENHREFAQLNQNNGEYRLYDEFVMANYLQWRRTFFFQMANIQNYVNQSRDDFN